MFYFLGGGGANNLLERGGGAAAPPAHPQFTPLLLGGAVLMEFILQVGIVRMRVPCNGSCPVGSFSGGICPVGVVRRVVVLAGVVRWVVVLVGIVRVRSCLPFITDFIWWNVLGWEMLYRVATVVYWYRVYRHSGKQTDPNAGSASE